MAYTTLEARQNLLDRVEGAAEQLGIALAYLGEAYEHLDDNAAERLEDELFRPVRKAYGLAKRDYAMFAVRHGLPPRAPEPKQPQVLPSDAKSAIDSALEAVGEADGILAELQDSMLPVEVGDAELRAALAQVRRLLGGLPEQARQLVRTLGR
ncbi:MAG: hypothetical protein ACRDLF_04130 [Solirubrobacteraceae bacterium]